MYRNDLQIKSYLKIKDPKLASSFIISSSFATRLGIKNNLLKKLFFLKKSPTYTKPAVLNEKLKTVLSIVILKLCSQTPTSPNFYTNKQNLCYYLYRNLS